MNNAKLRLVLEKLVNPAKLYYTNLNMNCMFRQFLIRQYLLIFYNLSSSEIVIKIKAFWNRNLDRVILAIISAILKLRAKYFKNRRTSLSAVFLFANWLFTLEKLVKKAKFPVKMALFINIRGPTLRNVFTRLTCTPNNKNSMSDPEK